MPKNTLLSYFLAEGHEKAIVGWFDALHLQIDKNINALEVMFPHTYFATWFKQNWQEIFEQHVQKALNIYKIVYTTQVETKLQITTQSYANTIPRQKYSEITHNSKQTFLTFLSNRKFLYILNHYKSLCEKEPLAANLNLLHGASGTGKTHIFQSMTHILQKRTISYRLYDTPEQFLNSTNKKTFVENVAYIFIDNMHTIQNEHQDKFVQLIDIIKQNKIYCFIAGTDSPNTWPLKNTLRSRFSDAIWLMLPMPDLDIRLQYAHQWSQKHIVHITKEHILLIAQSCQTIRQLSGILQQLMVQEKFLEHALNTADIENILHHNDVKNLTPQDIITQVAYYYAMLPKEILQEKRNQKRVQARYIAMFLCRELLGHSYPSIGRSFAGKDHSTVIYGIRKIKQLQKDNKDIDNDIQQLTKQCLQKNI